jgi:acyl carrier protein
VSAETSGSLVGAIAATDRDGIRRQIHEFIRVSFLFDGSSETLSDTASLMEEGIVDDTGILEVVLFLEETWGITVNRDDLAPENLDSIDALADYVTRQLGQR